MLLTLWATSSLETFACQIKVSLPDSPTLQGTSVEPVWRGISVKFYHEFQALVHKYLAKQKQLKDLHWAEAEVTMTLDSGLDELKVLKQMKTLDVRGLFQRQEPRQEAMKDWLAANMPAWTWN
ncbi:hypothetical protein CPC16_000776 [Podila verticillata]|nr:hypothetical protein BGZ52_001679 [Haplosporangium bisporale]KAF9205910.1 hypothetical protein BGZ59_000216 [Podila verticillata]KAF9375346.1 hypothetical protein CPC16_000776 [Podila verticillata]